MITNNYEEAKKYFMNNVQYGWKYIDCFVMNEKLYTELKSDMSLRLGSRIELDEGVKNRSPYVRLNSTLNGYGIILINPDIRDYSIDYIVYNRTIDERLAQLLNYNISRDYIEK